MLLAIDLGNTNTVLALYKTETPLKVWRIQSVAGRTEDEYAVVLREMFQSEGYKFEDIDAVIVSSVIPDANPAITRFGKKYFSISPVFIGQEGVELGIEIQLPKPKEVGADRIVNAIAAKEQYALPLIVIDFGTATTFDIVSSNGAYTGGIIAPGPNLSMTALYEAAAKLPKVDIQKPASVIGNDTVSAMQSGLYWGYVYLIGGLIDAVKTEMKEKKITVIATGGLATLFAKDIAGINHVNSDLTMQGLYSLYEMNKNKTHLWAKEAA